MTDPEAARPASMSDRRFITVLISALVAVLGAGLIVVAIIGLQDPVIPSGEIGTPTDISRVLVGLIALGAVLVLAGVSTVAALVRAQLRAQP